MDRRQRRPEQRLPRRPRCLDLDRAFFGTQPVARKAPAFPGSSQAGRSRGASLSLACFLPARQQKSTRLTNRLLYELPACFQRDESPELLDGRQSTRKLSGKRTTVDTSSVYGHPPNLDRASKSCQTDGASISAVDTESVFTAMLNETGQYDTLEEYVL